MTAFGFTWGFFLSRGRVTREGNMWVFQGLPNWAFGRGGTCVGGCYLTAHNVSAAVLRHEKIHVDQWRKYGLAFLPLYYASGINPLKNRFEIEAGLADGGYL